MTIVLTNCDFPPQRTSNANEQHDLDDIPAIVILRSSRAWIVNERIWPSNARAGGENKCLPHPLRCCMRKSARCAGNVHHRCLLDISIREKLLSRTNEVINPFSHKYRQLTADKAQSGCSRWISLSCAFEQRRTLSRC